MSDVASFMSLDSDTSKKQANYFVNVEPSKWSLLKFLKRKKPGEANYEISWKREYEAYEDHIKSIHDDSLKNDLFIKYKAEKFSIGIKKFWSGWCQQYGKNDKYKIPNEARDFTDKVLIQKNKNQELLKIQKKIAPNILKSGKSIEELLETSIQCMQSKNSYYNHEIYSNIINLNNFDIKIIFDEDTNYLKNLQEIPKFSLEISESIFNLFENEIQQPIKLHLYNNSNINTISFNSISNPIIPIIKTNLNIIIVTVISSNNTSEISSIFTYTSLIDINILIIGLLIYVEYVIKEFNRIYNYQIIIGNDKTISENTWTIEILSIFLKKLFDTIPDIQVHWAEHYSESSKIRMISIQDSEEEKKMGHKVDFNIIWKDNWKCEDWEMLVGEFSGKPFDIDVFKTFKDKCKLFRCMKDILDFRILKIIKHFKEKINEEIFKIIQTMQVFGIHSHGTIIDIYILNKPFPQIYNVNLWKSLEIPYKKDENYQEDICNLIENFWIIVKGGIINEIYKIIKIHELSKNKISTDFPSYIEKLEKSQSLTIVSPEKLVK